MPSFSAQVSGWVRQSKEDTERVVKASAQQLAREVTTPRAKGGNMPVDTGYLRASLMASTAAMPRINPTAAPPSDAQPGTYSFDEGQVNLVIANAEIEDDIYLGFTAAYARVRENDNGFVRLAAQRWPQIVKQMEARAGRSRR